MVSALDSSWSPSPGTALFSWTRQYTLTVPLFTQVYKWVEANLTARGNPVID